MAISTYQWFRTWLGHKLETAAAHLLDKSRGSYEPLNTPLDPLPPPYDTSSFPENITPAPASSDEVGTEPSQSGDEEEVEEEVVETWEQLTDLLPWDVGVEDQFYGVSSSAALEGLLEAVNQPGDRQTTAALTAKAIFKAVSLAPSYGGFVAATSIIESCAVLLKCNNASPGVERGQAFKDALVAADNAGLEANARIMAMHKWPLCTVHKKASAPKSPDPSKARAGGSATLLDDL